MEASGQTAPTDQAPPEEQQQEQHEDELEAQKMIAPMTQTVEAATIQVRSIDEERYPDDHPSVKLRGQLKKRAGVNLEIDTIIPVPMMVPTPQGHQQVIGGTLALRTVVSGVTPDLAIEVGKAMQQFGEEAKATMKEQPVVSDKLSIAAGPQDVAAAAAGLDPEQLAKAAGGPR